MADVEQAIEQANSPAGGGWWISEGERLICETQTSRDPSRSNNGGEYFYYREFTPDGLGVAATDEWSAEFDIRQYGGQDDYYDCLVSLDGLKRMAKLAEVTLAARSWLSKEPGSMRLLKSAIRALEE